MKKKVEFLQKNLSLLIPAVMIAGIGLPYDGRIEFERTFFKWREKSKSSRTYY